MKLALYCHSITRHYLQFNMKKQNEPNKKPDELRQKAEILLDKKKNGTKSYSFDQDKLSFIRELEMHQIELEMQNDELKLAKEKAEITKKKYIELYDFAPSGYLTLTKNGEIIDLNISAERLLGKERFITD